jgi:hypothetical protein
VNPLFAEHNFNTSGAAHQRALQALQRHQAATANLRRSRGGIPLVHRHKATRALPVHRMPVRVPREAAPRATPHQVDSIEPYFQAVRAIGSSIPITAPYFQAIKAIETIPVVGPAVKAIGEAPIRALLSVFGDDTVSKGDTGFISAGRVTTAGNPRTQEF